MPNSILESLEEQRKFYLYQERICHNRRSHVGHLLKDKGQLSYNLSKQAEQFAQAHSLLIRSQNHLQQQQQSEQQQQQQQQQSEQAAKRIDEREKFEVDVQQDEATRLIADAIESCEISHNLDNKLRITDSDQQDSKSRRNRPEKNTYNITSNPLCDHQIETDNITPTTSNALVLRPPESSFAIMAKSPLFHYNNASRTSNNKQTNPMMEPFKEEDPEDYDLGDKFNGGSIAYRNLLYEINRLFSEHNTLLDNLSTTSIGQQQQQRQPRQSTQAGNSSEHRPIQTTMQLLSDKSDNDRQLLDIGGSKTIGDTSAIIQPVSSKHNSNIEWKGEINDQKFSDTLNKLRWNQSKLRNIISDLVQQLEKTSEDNERLRCQIMTQRSRPDSGRSDPLCHLPPLEPPTLQY